ncbi:MAG: hypothetical protein LBV34_18935 [Nocardiopsaceae bacterium]|jgi:RNA polymerase sigma-70 factor (ECF subfamily)|nr:hypothetical protein [Nocardiopsaceae bacterium]
MHSAGLEGQTARARLREALLAAAQDESLRRWPDQAGPAWRRGQKRARAEHDDSGATREHSDLAERAVDSAVSAISGELDRYRAETRFTTWAYKYLMFGLSEAAGRQFWSGQRWPVEYDWKLLAARRPADLAVSGREWRDTIAALRRAVDLELTGSQRAIFAAVALSDLPPEALTCGLGPNRNAIYRDLFEARRRVSTRLAAEGLMQADEGPWPPARQFAWLRTLLVADAGDTGCDFAFQALDQFAEADLAGSDPHSHFPGVTAHLAGCRSCSQDYEGLLSAARREGERPAEPTQPDSTQAQSDPAPAKPVQPQVTQSVPAPSEPAQPELTQPEPAGLDPTQLALSAAG